MLRLAYVPQPVLPLLPSAVWGLRSAALALSLLSTSAAQLSPLSSELSLCTWVYCISNIVLGPGCHCAGMSNVTPGLSQKPGPF